jgi:hypothetical protein
MNLFFSTKDFQLSPFEIFLLPCMLRLKPRSWHACCHHLTLESMLRMILQLELCLMMGLWSEIDCLLSSKVDHRVLEPFVWS